MDLELALNALLMAALRRQPMDAVMVHSEQGSQFSSYDWQIFLEAYNLQQHEPTWKLSWQRHGRATLSMTMYLYQRRLISAIENLMQAFQMPI